MTRQDKSEIVRRIAREVGFDTCGIARAAPIGRADYLREWLEAGRVGSMGYLHKHLDKRLDPRGMLEGAQSVIVVALLYHQNSPQAVEDCPAAKTGRVAMYAWGDDYHDVLGAKLNEMIERVRPALVEKFEAFVCVDTAPIVEREWAAAAGIGWIGKNTLVLNRELGSYFFLGVVVTTLELEPDEPVEDHCGSCTACLEACPTAAFTAPYHMDASRCISYLTIEHRGDISKPFQEMMGDWIFGCDVCQEVCPHNRKAAVTREPRFAPRETVARLPVDEVRLWDEQEYRARFQGSAILRAKVGMMQRNARIVEANA